MGTPPSEREVLSWDFMTLFVGPHDSPNHSRIRTETSGLECHKGVIRMET